jgi:hypothetical protein
VTWFGPFGRTYRAMKLPRPVCTSHQWTRGAVYAAQIERTISLSAITCRLLVVSKSSFFPILQVFQV